MSSLQIAQKKMIKMLEMFHNICLKLNIKYWSLGGTLIGAVRHSGFIPWNGDVEVAMLLDDYKILEKHIQDELPSTMYFFGMHFPGLAKIRDLYSSYTEQSDKNHNNHHGLQLDIFIYNVSQKNGEKQILSIHTGLDDYKENYYK